MSTKCLCRENLTQPSLLEWADSRKAPPKPLLPEGTVGLAGGRKNRVLRTCRACGKQFYGRTNKTKFCSAKCYHSRPVTERLWPRLSIADNGCWNWTGGKDLDGYGSLRWGKEQRAHRVAYILTKGEIPEGMFVLHSCDNPPCCNPLHLFIGTAADNNRDMVQKGRDKHRFGDNHPSSKVTAAEVLEIRAMHQSGKFTQREIAKHFCVGFKAINKIILRQRWCHV